MTENPKTLRAFIAANKIEAARPTREAGASDLGTTVVTYSHGITFAEAWIRRSWEAGCLFDAFGETHIIKWPSDDEVRQARYKDIEDDICLLVCESVRAAVAEAFVVAAMDVMARKQRRSG